MSGQSRLLVRGAGLMGASIGLAAREAGWSVQVQDVDPGATAAAAQVTGLAELGEGFQPDLVVVAVPPESVAEVVIDSLRLYPQSIVIDISSVKTELKLKVESLTSDSDHYVPTHPMAGKSVAGAINAAFDLLVDCRWVVCPRPQNDSGALDLVERLVRDCGATPIYMSVEAHDQAVAITSHLPQLLSSVLAKQLNALTDDEVAVSGPGLRDMTRLASSDVTLWQQIVKSNSRYIEKAIAKLNADLSELQNAISTKQFGDVATTIESGQLGRQRVPGKHGEVAETYSIVPVLIDDKPGQLAAIFRSAERANVNIEDVHIDHALGRQVAIVELSIKPDSALTLENVLKSDGWTLRPTVIAD